MNLLCEDDLLYTSERPTLLAYILSFSWKINSFISYCARLTNSKKNMYVTYYAVFKTITLGNDRDKLG